MSKKYLLPCSCGESIPVELAQAGQSVGCVCGKTLQVPSMLNLKKLQSVESETPFETHANREATGNLRFFFQTLGGLILIASLIFLGWVLTTAPKPSDVMKKRTQLSYGSSIVYQDSTPLPGHEESILQFEGDHVEYMSPFQLFMYFRTLQNGPMLSYNFQENYQMLKDAYHIRLGTAIVGVGVGLFFLLLSLLMPKRTKDVAVRRGSEWG